MQENLPKLSVQIALLMQAHSLGLLSPTGGERRLLKIASQQNSEEFWKAALEIQRTLAQRSWDFQSLWTKHGQTLNRYTRPSSQAPVRRPQRVRGYRDKGTLPDLHARARRDADREGSFEGALEQLTYSSSDYDGETYYRLLTLGAFAKIALEPSRKD